MTFVVDRALDERAGERGVRACGTAEALGRWDARATRARLQTGGSGDRNRHACTVRCALEEEIIFKLVTVDEDGGGGAMERWSGGAIYAAEAVRERGGAVRVAERRRAVSGVDIHDDGCERE